MRTWRIAGKREFVCCLAVALVLRLGFALVVLPFLDARLNLHYAASNYDADGYGPIADSILQLRYTDVERAPLYPAFVALIYALFHGSTPAVKAAQAVVDTMTVALIWRLGARIAPGSRIGPLAGWLYALYPLAWWRSGFIYKETLETFSLMLFVSVWLAGPISRRRSTLSGIVLGLVNLVKPIFLGLPLVVGVWLWHRHRKSSGACWLSLVGGVALVVLPWTVRNYVVAHEFIPVAVEEAGQTAFVGNFAPSLGAWEGPHKEAWEADLAHIAAAHPGADAATLDRAYLAAAADEVRSQPGVFPEMLALKAWRFWFSNASGRLGIAVVVVQAVFLGLAVWGLVKRSLPADVAWFFGLVIGYTWLLHALVYADVRFSLPLIPYVVLFGAAALAPRVSEIAPASEPAPQPCSASSMSMTGMPSRMG
jgi:hypothetical protein